MIAVFCFFAAFAGAVLGFIAMESWYTYHHTIVQSDEPRVSAAERRNRWIEKHHPYGLDRDL